MKQFFKFVFASMLAIIVMSVLFVLIILAFIASSSDKTVVVNSGSILQISFNAPIVERSPNDPIGSLLGIEADKAIGLNDILADIAKAKTDNKIKGIFLDESAITPGEASSEEI